MGTKKTAQVGMLVAAAFVLGYVESLLPISFGIPGIKLGLSNIVVLLCLYEGTAKEAFGIALVRIVLTGLTFGNFSTMAYSLAGGIFSFLVMFLLKKSNVFSVYGVSIAGGVSHNIGQIAVAVLVLQTGLLMYYLPFLLVAGCVAGACIGFVGGILVKRLHGLF
ncbi:MAG: Gx transporter family protein [Lachnospiraceae bacterium]|jgi:Predicted membrane protein|nr:Gx transporter family protein [Lachnospiraceae bacterium]